MFVKDQRTPATDAGNRIKDAFDGHCRSSLVVQTV
jgi:hypothetical protein